MEITLSGLWFGNVRLLTQSYIEVYIFLHIAIFVFIDALIEFPAGRIKLKA